MKNKHTVVISDIRINILTEESEEFVNEIVDLTENRIKEIVINGTHISKIEAALFCALDYCGDKIKAQKKLNNAEAQIALYLASINRLQIENDELRARLAQCDANYAEKKDANIEKQ